LFKHLTHFIVTLHKMDIKYINTLETDNNGRQRI